MVFLRQVQRALHESYRFVVRNPKSTGWSILRLWLAYGSVLLLWLLSANVSRSTERFLATATMTVVVRGNAPGMAVLGEQLATMPGVIDVEYRLTEHVMSSSLSGSRPGVLPSFSVQTIAHHPDSLAQVASRMRQLDDVVDVIYSREHMKGTVDLLAWLRLVLYGFRVVVVGLVVVVTAWEMHDSVGQRTVGTWVMRRLGATRLFIAAPAAVIGGLNGIVASGLAVWSVLGIQGLLADQLAMAETLVARERILFVIGGTFLGSFANFAALLMAPVMSQWHGMSNPPRKRPSGDEHRF